MSAVRRRMPSRERTTTMKPNAIAVQAMKTSTANSMPASPSSPANMSSRKSMSDPEIDHAIHQDIADQHPGAGRVETVMREIVLPDAAIEVGRDDLHDAEHADRQRRKD